MIYSILKNIYFLIPGKLFVFDILRRFNLVNLRLAGFLKFQGVFNLDINSQFKLKIINDNSTLPSLLYWKGIHGYEPKSLAYWIELSKSSNRIIDAGANFGLYGLISKAVNPDSDVTFFEPLARNSNRIRSNLKLNNYNGQVIEEALSDQVGKSTFYDMLSHENTIGSLSRKFVENHEHSDEIFPIKVNTNTLDTFIAQSQLPQIDLIKIDVEGSELKVLRGFIHSIEKMQPTIILEISGSTNPHDIDIFVNKLCAKYYIYEIDESEGLKKLKSFKESRSRNHLLSKHPLS